MTPDRMARITTKGFTVAVTKPPLALSWRGVLGFVTRGRTEIAPRGEWRTGIDGVSGFCGVVVTKPPLALSWRGVLGFVTRGYVEKHTAGVLRWRP